MLTFTAETVELQLSFSFSWAAVGGGGGQGQQAGCQGWWSGQLVVRASKLVWLLLQDQEATQLAYGGSSGRGGHSGGFGL